RVHWSHWSLDEKLAAGFDPESDPSLGARAAQLTSRRHRRRLAASVERLVHDSQAPQWSGMSAAVPIIREQVREARDSLLRLAALLRDAEHVKPRGVAMVERLLTDADSYVFTKSARGVVELQVQAALAALEVTIDREAQDAAPIIEQR